MYCDGIDVVSVVRRNPFLDLAAMLVGHGGVIVNVYVGQLPERTIHVLSRTYPRSAAVLGDGSVSEATLAAARQAVNACPEQAIGLVD